MSPRARIAHLLSRAKGRRRAPHDSRQMNRTEAAFAQLLRARVDEGHYLSFRYESIKLRLADRTWYTPDFQVMLKDGSIHFYEVKGGHWEDDARVKIKTAAEQYPEYRFIAAQLKAAKSPWTYEQFNEPK